MPKDEKKGSSSSTSSSVKAPISDMLKKLLEPQEVVVSRYKTREGFKEAIGRGFFLVRFPKLFGGGELGVNTKDAPFKDMTKWQDDSVEVCGKLEFQGVSTKFKGNFNLASMEGVGCLELFD
ncbi:hypothetical protein DLAC_03496 [Tieghemostelium lacteum]|uniref:Uncharacterized protein n=1 Tax=Tieghemostelium lacteum TaxID=361077 RepID=A0A152A180_TIELA|nr:hypothetical protein DLAC_03496 [Tieghemostelium lacteum]|eukprot:KYR00002.1 hypothetical protein DLAC_03496 [Tieghemostelium lacteum]